VILLFEIKISSVISCRIISIYILLNIYQSKSCIFLGSRQKMSSVGFKLERSVESYCRIFLVKGGVSIYKKFDISCPINR